MLRHGLLAPLYLVIIYDLAHGRGLLARVLALPGLRPLGDASFSIFVLQLPIGLIVLGTATAMQLPSFLSVPMAISIVVAVSLLSTNYLEKPVSRWLRAKARDLRTPLEERRKAVDIPSESTEGAVATPGTEGSSASTL